ncbi:MAG: sugar transferase [Bacteroidota bacterium]
MYARYLKRLTDITFSILLMATFSILFVLIILLYLFSAETPVFFRQLRIGKNEKTFNLIKFRTLKATEGAIGQRRFWLGDLLRTLSLDELPQLINVLKGEMSLIGPRPLPVEYLPFFSETQRLRHQVRPGITGWAQVNGRHSISWEAKFDYDLHYIRNVTFWLDFRIFVKTIVLILSFKKDLSLLEEKFKGQA